MSPTEPRQDGTWCRNPTLLVFGLRSMRATVCKNVHGTAKQETGERPDQSGMAGGCYACNCVSTGKDSDFNIICRGEERDVVWLF